MAKQKKDISVVERRLKSGAIFGQSAKPLPLKEPKRWELRFVNTQIGYDRQLMMQEDKGWIYASPEDFAVPLDQVGLRAMDGKVVRGQHGEEVVMKMLKSDYKAVQQMKEQENRRRTFGKKAIKSSILAAASREPDGDHGADFLNRAAITVEDSLERVVIEE